MNTRPSYIRFLHDDFTIGKHAVTPDLKLFFRKCSCKYLKKSFFKRIVRLFKFMHY